jgi:hypothetical protein
VDSLAPTQDSPAQAQERLNGIYGRLNKIMGHIGAEIRARRCEIPESPERIDQIWDCLMWRHYFPPEDSVASLASLHAFVNRHRDETVAVGDEQLPACPRITQCLDGMIDQARPLNDAD